MPSRCSLFCLYENPACPHGLQGYPKNNLTLNN
nr:MAG TPA: hypothetical protein [Caudoviricetes sp.]DAV12526.1 MAG TPA: hypothetical protein [Bacteriophage sp.]